MSSPNNETSEPGPSSPQVQETGSPVPGHLPLEADDNFPESDTDSFYGSDNASTTTSLSASVYQYRVENGRTYHAYKAGAYYMPNDDVENDRLDLQHHLMLVLFDNRLHLCPAGKDKPLKNVLDAGCGTGIWCIDFADAHPETSVIGVDLSPIQPKDIPPNLEFQVDDLEEPWTFTQKFDLINFRMMCGCMKDWSSVLGQALEHMAPGGYIELCDPMNPIRSDDGTLPENSALLEWERLLVEASDKLGRPLSVVAGHKQRLIDAGFVNVTEVLHKWPINEWPKDKKYKHVGGWVCQNMSEAIRSMSLMLFTNVLGWPLEQVEVFLTTVRKELRDMRIHAYWPVYTVYGQKPE